MKKTIVIPTLLLALIFSTSIAFAWGGSYGRGCNGPGSRGPGMGMHGGGMYGGMHRGMDEGWHQQKAERHLDRMAVILDLTDEQQQQLAELFDKQWQQRQELRQQMRENRSTMHDYRFDNEFNEEEFRTQARKQADLRTEMMAQRANMHQDMLAILTPAQQEKAEKLHALPGQGFGPQKGWGECDGPGGYGGMKGHRACGY